MPSQPPPSDRNSGFSHLAERGRAQMVDVSEKPVTRRVAEASCRLICAAETVARLASLPKGDAVAVARLAGIQAAKRTDEWIPLAHTLPVEEIAIDFERRPGELAIRSRIVATARTGAEMEALVACAAAALAIYDMAKAVDRGMVIGPIMLEAKRGGRSGEWTR